MNAGSKASWSPPATLRPRPGGSLRHIDAANVDLKAFSERFYHKLTFSHLDPVLATLNWLKHETDIWFEITNLMIPGENDDPDETKRLCEWIVSHLGDAVPVHFTAFHPDFKLTDKPRTPATTLARARQIAKSSGIKFAYVGNVHDDEATNDLLFGLLEP